MKKNIVLVVLLIISLLFGGIVLHYKQNNFNQNKFELEAVIVSLDDTHITVIDKENIIYNFSNININANLGDNILIKYTGMLDKNNTTQSIEIISASIIEQSNHGSKLNDYKDNGIFRTYYVMAYNKLKELNLDEKIGQLILARYSSSNLLDNLQKYKMSGFVFYEKDFKNKTIPQVQEMINQVQKNSNIPLLIAVDEEGGKIVRVSSNPNLSPSKFKSPQDLYSLGGMNKITEDTITKSQILSNLGINLNLAPVVDVSTSPNDYIYERTLGQNTEITSLYAQTVIKASKGLGVSYTLKHFPGYGSNTDTHTGSSISNQSYENLMKNDIPPFKSGINAGAEAILISHNIITSIDNTNPASLSPNIHNLLRNELNFTGIIITDDIHMGATKKIDNAAVLAILSGNNLIITTNYIDSINSIKDAINNNIISEELINRLAFRVLAWKYYKNLMVSEK